MCLEFSDASDNQEVNDYNTGQTSNIWGEVGFRMCSRPTGSELDFINVGTAFTLNQTSQFHQLGTIPNPASFVNSVTINETGYYECSYYVSLDDPKNNLGILNDTSGSILMCSETDTKDNAVMYKFVFKLLETSTVRLVALPDNNSSTIIVGQSNQKPDVTISSLTLKKLANL